MKTSLGAKELGAYVAAQANAFFPDPAPLAADDVVALLPHTLGWVERCFGAIRKKYFHEDGAPVFSHLHSDQYAMFLYMLANTAGKAGAEAVATKAFLLNKALHGIDAFYAVQLPEVFLFVHPIGTILGNARYGDYFTVYQNCTVGAEEDGVYPEFGDGAILYARAAVIGRSRLGRNVTVGANAFLLNATIPDDSVVVGAYPQLKVTPNGLSFLDRKFRDAPP